jgi:hypothetical protein
VPSVWAGVLRVPGVVDADGHRVPWPAVWWLLPGREPGEVRILIEDFAHILDAVQHAIGDAAPMVAARLRERWGSDG